VSAPEQWTPVAYAAGPDGELAYQCGGPEDGRPLLLVAGLGEQMVYWRDELCADFAAAGFRVARFDNRDVGLSFHDPSAAPNRVRTVATPASVATYGLGDMAVDALAVLDALAWPRAVVFGVSLGGAVAQMIAINAPDRVDALVSVMSTPSLKLGRGTLRAMAALVRGPVRSERAAQDRMISLYKAIGSPDYPMDGAWLREVAAIEYRRAYDPGGARRQLAAIMMAADRRPGLAKLRLPTLVLHGEQDPVFRLAAGRATAETIPGARLVTFPGMGHDLPRPLWPRFVAEVASLTRE